MRRVCLLVLVTSCVESPEQITGASFVTVTDVDGDVTVNGPTYSMGFASSGVRMPNRFVLDGKETFAIDSVDTCANESNAGIGVFPAVNANSETQFVSRSTLVRRLEGPVVAKIDVTYEVDYSCNAMLQTLSGTSHFIFFPSGRIVRFDEHVLPASEPLPASPQCGCQDASPGGAYTFSSYWAFNPENATLADGFGAPRAKGDLTGNACTIYPDRAIGIAPGMEGQTRLAPHSAASHVFEFVSEAASLVNEEQFLFTALQVSPADSLGPGDCTELVLQLVDEPINIGGECDANTDACPRTGNDAIYVGTTPHPNPFDIKLPPGGTTIPGGFAVAVNLGGATRGIVTKSPPIDRDGPVAFTQADDQGNILFYFPEPLDATQTITIEPIF
ncbi:MAG: hypothetical protein ABI867_17795 [Kofleriaceae bacterium]